MASDADRLQANTSPEQITPWFGDRVGRGTEHVVGPGFLSL